MVRVVQLKALRKLTDNEKLVLLKQHFVPSRNYKFPTRSFHGHCRHFQQRWLEQYNGLVYSESEDGGYCKFCVLFGKCGPTAKELGVLVNRPLTNFRKATEKLGEHFHCLKGKKYHQAALEAATAFTAAMIQRYVESLFTPIHLLIALMTARRKVSKNKIMYTLSFDGIVYYKSKLHPSYMRVKCYR